MENQTIQNTNEVVPTPIAENGKEDFFTITEKDINDQFDRFIQDGEQILANSDYEGIDKEKLKDQIMQSKELREEAISRIEAIKQIN
ncbi:MAG: hypothetical protein ACD_15C00165G0012 [uncultured bacterium]|nr:MAG: hypothetical protein ACD_15C00165G0012 [uncultured bacterium]HCU70349.1 hypothetical protein [Candidatus Moranbacteria bacterium]